MIIIDYSKNIQQTVALPCYNAKNIGWLAMESLCRQDPTSYDWELIVCEEPHEKMLGEDFFASYANRLLYAGCNRVVYLSPKKWIPLSQKWRVIAQAAHKESISFLLHAADCYSFNGRLEMSQKMIQQGHDWVDVTKGYFYSITKKKLIIYDENKRNNLYTAIPTAKARKIPYSVKRRRVDGFVYKSTKVKNPCHIERLFADGLDTDGENVISLDRQKYYNNFAPPFRSTDKTIQTIGLPNDIVDRLCTL